MSLVLNSSGGGSVTLSEPVTASNVTQNIVAASGYIPVAAASGVINAGAVSGSLCRAWVNFNGTGTVAIRAAFNVSSITDNAVGDYTVNFTTAMPDVNYAMSGAVDFNTGGSFAVLGNTNTAKTTSAYRIYTWGGGSIFDFATVTLNINR